MPRPAPTAARTTYYDAAAARMLAGLPFKTEAAIAKLVASEAAMDNGARRDSDPWRERVHERLPGSPATTATSKNPRGSVEGTTEVQLMLIARGLGI